MMADSTNRVPPALLQLPLNAPGARRLNEALRARARALDAWRAQSRAAEVWAQAEAQRLAVEDQAIRDAGGAVEYFMDERIVRAPDACPKCWGAGAAFRMDLGEVPCTACNGTGKAP